MIDPEVKRALGHMTYGVQVVGCRSADVTRAFTSTWTYQVSFGDPVIATSISPKHDTYPLIVDEGWYSISILAGDQITEAQYFSYPGRRFRRALDFLEDAGGIPVVRNCVAWLRADVVGTMEVRDHVLLVGEVTAHGAGRLGESALTYSSRRGWRIADTPARDKGVSVRDELLRQIDETGDSD